MESRWEGASALGPRRSSHPQRALYGLARQRTAAERLQGPDI
jgi:hypothetical protein